MPIYRYRCDACEKTSEVWARMSDPPPEACPECGGGPLHKAVARTAFVLKGGGWYAQGYGASGGAGAASGSASAGGDAGGGSGDTAGSSGGAGDSGGASGGAGASPAAGAGSSGGGTSSDPS